MIKTAKPIHLDKQQIILLSKGIIGYLKDTLYQPLANIYKEELKQDLRFNDISSKLQQAFKNGKIYFDNGYIKGQFNSSIVKELESIGAKYSTYNKAFKINELPAEIKSIIINKKSKIKEAIYYLDNNLNDYLLNLEDSIKFLDLSYKDTIDNYYIQLKGNLEQFSIIPSLNNYQIKSINENYVDNSKLYIKKWLERDIRKLREQMKKYVLEEGYNNQDIANLISKTFNITQNKAVFLARQESSLLLAEYQKSKYKSLGLNRYIWQTANDEKVRDYPINNESGGNHKDLNGKEFRFDDPPIVNFRTGKRANPSEDYNCRCLARVIVE